jgi:error-prone DNA polymerase
VSYSFAQNTLEQGDGEYCAVRLGFRQIDGFKWADPDEQRLKQSLLLESASQPSFRGTRSVNHDAQLRIGESQSANKQSRDSGSVRCANCPK